MKCDHAGPLAKVEPDAEDVEPVDLAVALAQELVVLDRVEPQLQQVRQPEHRAACLLQSRGSGDGHCCASATLE